MWDPQQDAIAHCSRVLKVDQCNVKALYRRAIAHLLLPADRHINGLACALDDLQRAIQLEPQNAELKRELKRAKAMQRELDQRQAGMFTRMIGEGEAV
jgi:FK506-binding protein 4/5